MQSAATVQNPVQLLGVYIQFCPHLPDLFCFDGIFFRCSGFGDFCGFPQLLQDILLLGFIGMQLQAEGTDADVFQTFLDNFQRCHFLCHKQNTLALCQRIGDQRCDGLGFTGTGRAVKHKALTCTGCLDSMKLGSIRRHRQQNIVLVDLLTDLQRLCIPAQFAFD